MTLAILHIETVNSVLILQDLAVKRLFWLSEEMVDLWIVLWQWKAVKTHRLNAYCLTMTLWAYGKMINLCLQIVWFWVTLTGLRFLMVNTFGNFIWSKMIKKPNMCICQWGNSIPGCYRGVNVNSTHPTEWMKKTESLDQWNFFLSASWQQKLSVKLCHLSCFPELCLCAV